MRKLRMFNRVTPEGYFASPDGGLGWVVPEPELDRAAAESLGGTDAILFGRRTYEMFESFWPRLLDAPDAASNPHGAPSPQMRAMAEWMRDAEKIVFSRTRTETTWANSRIVPALDPAAIDAMKRAP
ncbi:MAG TPA: hypothetical protein VFQ39_10445, partial [Longimicrobium sp.]|nr:hypothetical protein [Longimicrobium sp.]